tara:strand:- start:366 stop:488 length:123 start_codon:yes stop_codon:yes gene_type:complete
MKYVFVIVACLSFGFLTACQTAGGGATMSTSSGGGEGGGC